MMDYTFLLYEAGILVIIIALSLVGLVLFKLTRIINEKKKIWILPIVAAVFMFVSLAAHFYASAVLMPSLDKKISSLSSQEILMNADKLTAVKAAINITKASMMNMKLFSFSCFLLASLLLVVATGVYIKWISK